MTKPKKWHLDYEDGDIILKYDANTPVSKPNAVLPLGAVQSVTVYDPQSLELKGKLPKDKALKVRM